MSSAGLSTSASAAEPSNLVAEVAADKVLLGHDESVGCVKDTGLVVAPALTSNAPSRRGSASGVCSRVFVGITSLIVILEGGYWLR